MRTTPRRLDNIEQVENVLAEIGADEVPVLKIYNKLDLLPDQQPRVDRDENGLPVRVWLSAQNGDGLDILYDAIAERLGMEVIHQRIALSPQQGKLRALFHDAGVVLNENYDEQGRACIEIRMERLDYERCLRQAETGELELTILSS